MSFIHKLLALLNARKDRKVLNRVPIIPSNNAVKKIREPITYYSGHDKTLKRMFYRYDSVANAGNEEEGYLHGQKPH